MYVNNLPRVALDSGAAGIRTCDMLIASPEPEPLGHCRRSLIKYVGQGKSGQAIKLFQITPYVSDFPNTETVIWKIYGSLNFSHNLVPDSL